MGNKVCRLILSSKVSRVSCADEKAKEISQLETDLSSQWEWEVPFITLGLGCSRCWQIPCFNHRSRVLGSVPGWGTLRRQCRELREGPICEC